MLTFTATATGNYTIRASCFSNPGDPGHRPARRSTCACRASTPSATPTRPPCAHEPRHDLRLPRDGHCLRRSRPRPLRGHARGGQFLHVQAGRRRRLRHRLHRRSGRRDRHDPAPAKRSRHPRRPERRQQLPDATSARASASSPRPAAPIISTSPAMPARPAAMSSTSGYRLPEQGSARGDQLGRAPTISTPLRSTASPPPMSISAPRARPSASPASITFGWNANEKAAVMSALLEFTKITGITYLETTDINQAEFRLNTVSTRQFRRLFLSAGSGLRHPAGHRHLQRQQRRLGQAGRLHPGYSRRPGQPRQGRLRLCGDPARVRPCPRPRPPARQ